VAATTDGLDVSQEVADERLPVCHEPVAVLVLRLEVRWREGKEKESEKREETNDAKERKKAKGAIESSLIHERERSASERGIAWKVSQWLGKKRRRRRWSSSLLAFARRSLQEEATKVMMLMLSRLSLARRGPSSELKKRKSERVENPKPN